MTLTKEQPDDLELHAWPLRPGGGGQQVTRAGTGVLAVHRPTGAAVVIVSERSQLRNRELAVERIRLLVAALPWSTT